MISIGAS